MKQIITLFLVFTALLVSIFSCQQEQEYPEHFSFDWNKETRTISEYESYFTDSTLDIYGFVAKDTLHFHLDEGENKLLVGNYSIGADSFYQLTYRRENGATEKADQGSIDIDYINFYTNFTFEGSFPSGDTIRNGKGEHIRLHRGLPPEEQIEPKDTFWNGYADGLYATGVNAFSTFFTPNALLTIKHFGDTVMIEAYKTIGNLHHQIRFCKPIEDLVGKEFDLSLENETKVTYRIDQGGSIWNPLSGKLKVEAYKDNKIRFRFSVHLVDDIQVTILKIPNGIGKDIQL